MNFELKIDFKITLKGYLFLKKEGELYMKSYLFILDEYRQKEEPEIVCHECEYCGGEIYKDEEFLFILIENAAVHEDCFLEYAKEKLHVILQKAGEY